MCYGPLGPLLFPLFLFIVPFGWEALHWIDPHVQHPLQLLFFVLRFKGVWDWSIDCKYRTHGKSFANYYITEHCCPAVIREPRYGKQAAVDQNVHVAIWMHIITIFLHAYHIFSATAQSGQWSWPWTRCLRTQTSTVLFPGSSQQSSGWSWCGTLAIGNTHTAR